MRTGNVFGNGTPSAQNQRKVMTRGCVGAPILLGNIDSLSTLLWTHAIKCSMYSGAGIFVGRLKFSESCHRYSNLRHRQICKPEVKVRSKPYSSVAFISGQDCGEQNSVIDP